MTISTLLNRSCIIFVFALVGCTSPPIAPPRLQPTPQEQPRVVPQQTIQQVIPPKTASNALSAPAVKMQAKPSLGLVVANHKFLNGALVLRHDSFKGISPAEQSGIKGGDIITAVSACEVTNIATYFACVEKFMPNQLIKVTFNRDDVIMQTWVKLGERY